MFRDYYLKILCLREGIEKARQLDVPHRFACNSKKSTAFFVSSGLVKSVEVFVKPFVPGPPMTGECLRIVVG